MIGEKVWSTSLSYNGEVGRLRTKMFDLAKVNIMQQQFVLPNSVFHNFFSVSQLFASSYRKEM